MCDHHDPGPPPRSPSVAPVEVSSLPDGAFATIGDLRAAFEAAGGKCPEWQGAILARDYLDNDLRGDCSYTTTLLFYRDPAGLADDALGLGRDSALIVGPNWIVTGSGAGEVDAASLGGTFVKKRLPPPDSPCGGWVTEC